MTRPRRLGLETLEDRTTPTYALDPTFSGDGLLQVHLANSVAQVATVVQPDGRILVQENTDDGPMVVRFNPDGTPDTTFGDGGHVTLPANPQMTTSLALGADGLIYALVASDEYPRVPRVARLTADGSLDPSFGDGGFATPPFPWVYGRAVLAAQPDGKIVVATTTHGTRADGSYGQSVILARLLPTGEADASFGGDGVFEFGPRTETGPWGDLGGLAAAPDGKLVVTVTSSDPRPSESVPGVWPAELIVARVTADGALDTSFDGDGRWVSGQDGAPDVGGAAVVAVQPDGKVVLVGLPDSTGVRVVRLNADGSADAGFGDGGQAEVADMSGDQAVGLLPDGRIVVATTSLWTPSRTMVVGILTPDGRPDPTFGGSGTTQISFPGGGGPWRTDSAEALAVGPDGRIVVVGKAYTNTASPEGFRENDLIVAVLSDQDTPPPPEPPGPGEPPPPFPVDPPPGTGETPPPIPVDPPPGTGETPPGVPIVLPIHPPLPPGGLPPPPPPGGPPTAVVEADFNGDGVNDRIVVTGTTITIIDGSTPADGTPVVPPVTPFEASFRGKLNVAAGDVTDDGVADLVVSADGGGGPVVVVYDGAKLAAGGDRAAAELVRFYGIDDPNFRGGARIAVGDLDGDGTPDVVVAAAPDRGGSS